MDDVAASLLSGTKPGLAGAFSSGSPEQTAALGSALGEQLGPGDVVGVVGELGAGKTVFVKGVAAGLGIDPDAVTSPTFTLVHTHQGRCRLFHLDLYRIERPEAVEGIGWDETVGGRGVAVVEWADRAAAWLPADRLEVHLAMTGETARRIEIAAFGERPRAHLGALLAKPFWASRRLPETMARGTEHRGER